MLTIIIKPVIFNNITVYYNYYLIINIIVVQATTFADDSAIPVEPYLVQLLMIVLHLLTIL